MDENDELVTAIIVQRDEDEIFATGGEENLENQEIENLDKKD
nr:hypothetical protein [Campylobacter jejuni]